MSLEAVTRFRVSREVVAKTERELRHAGRHGHELFVLWSGLIESGCFVVRTPHVPKQTSYKLRTGLCVRVEGEALHKLNTWLYKHEEMLGVQVHAHPTDAYHSDTDDAYPIVTAVGGVSIVAADFCRDGLIASTSAIYRLTGGSWVEQPLELLEIV